jgi:putative FmdB family regulatory protein
MPLYDYECKSCGQQEEVFQKFEEEPLSECPDCKEQEFRRVILQAPMAFVKGCNTVGWLADKNSKEMGRYGREERSAQDGSEQKKKVKETREMHKKLNKMTPAEKHNYIMKGK